MTERMSLVFKRKPKQHHPKIVSEKEFNRIFSDVHNACIYLVGKFKIDKKSLPEKYNVLCLKKKIRENRLQSLKYLNFTLYLYILA